MTVVETTLDEVLNTLNEVPDFRNPPNLQEALLKTDTRESLALIALENGQAVGCKYGFSLGDGVFYSWIGGVLPESRRLGVAQRLLEYQENWVRTHHYTRIQVKSMNRYPEMLRFLIRNGYRITGTEGEDPAELKVHFEKTFSNDVLL